MSDRGKESSYQYWYTLGWLSVISAATRDRRRGSADDAMAPKAEKSDAGSNTIKLAPPLFVALALGTLGCYFTFGPTAARVQKAVFSPDGVTPGESLDNFLFSLACIGFCGLFDALVVRPPLLHCMHA